MQDNEIYQRIFTPDNPVTKSILKTIFTEEIGAVCEDIADDETSFYLQKTQGSQVKLKITVTDGSNAGKVTVGLPKLDSTFSERAFSPTSSTPWVSFFYLKNSAGSFMFGFNFSSASSASELAVNYIFSSAQKFNDSSQTSDLIVHNGTSSAGSAEAVDKNQYVKRAFYTIADDNFVQLVPFCMPDKFVSSEVFLPSYGTVTSCGRYSFNGETYMALTKAYNGSSALLKLG